MLSRILLMCCLSFHLNGLLGEHLEQATYGNTTVTWLELDELDLENPVEGIFVFNDEQRNYYEQLAECKSRFPHPGVEVTLLKNVDYLLAASNLQSINFGAGHRIDLHFEIEQLEKYTYTGYWHWIDGSNFTADNEMWANKHPLSSNTWPNDRKVQCGTWKPSEDKSMIGTIQSSRCLNAMYHAICQISDTDECAAAVSPCHDPAGCINTVGGFQCTFLGDAIDVYTTVAEYYREVYNCDQANPNKFPGCSPHSRTDSSSDACYDEDYDKCTQAAYGDMKHILGDIYDVMVDCYGLPCPLGTADCHDDEAYECPGNEYVELFADLEKCGNECNLISECGGGGFDCLANEAVCKACFENLKSEEV